MQYTIKFDKKAIKFIQKQPKPQRERIFSSIYKLPQIGDIKAMQGYGNYYRLRVGDYRIIFTIDDYVLLIHIVAVGNRGDIYK